MQMLNVSLVVKLKFHPKQHTAPPPTPDSGWENNAGGKRNRPNSAALLDFATAAFPLVVSTSSHPKVTLEKWFFNSIPLF